MHASKKVYLAWLLLRITFGVLFIVVGIDKFFNYLTNWQQYIGTATNQLFAIDQFVLLKIFGLLQIVAGILLFTPWIKIGIYLIVALLLIIFINLFSVPASHMVIIHDVIMIAGIFVLWQLSEVQKI
jgi:uncharacterized membrane protein YphA (DoxX/SURF4 family)